MHQYQQPAIFIVDRGKQSFLSMMFEDVRIPSCPDGIRPSRCGSFILHLLFSCERPGQHSTVGSWLVWHSIEQWGCMRCWMPPWSSVIKAARTKALRLYQEQTWCSESVSMLFVSESLQSALQEFLSSNGMELSSSYRKKSPY